MGQVDKGKRSKTGKQIKRRLKTKGSSIMSIQEALLIIEMVDHDEVTALDFIEALETVEA